MKFRYPTQRELYAIDLEARRLRAETYARLGRKVARAVKNLFKIKSTKELSHA
jgi:hypothetical protein